MSQERISDTEFLNVLDVAGPTDLPRQTKALILELFLRVRSLEAQSLTHKAELLQEIAEGMSGELELLGTTPDKKDLRDRLRVTIRAVRDLAQGIQAVHAASPDSTK